MNYCINDIMPFIHGEYKLTGDVRGKEFNNLKPVLDAQNDSLVFVDSERKDGIELIQQTLASIILCDLKIEISGGLLGSKCLIQVEHPRLVFIRIGNKLFKEVPDFGVHPTAFIHPEAQIQENTYIGPFTYVGKCIIGEGTRIYGHVHVYDDVTIGKNAIIHAGCVIGADGFGYLRNEEGEHENFPHIGGVLIEDDVEIGANTCIDRGTLGNTVIRQGAKIDNLVHIAHNVIVGKHALIIANAMIGGSTLIDDYAWVSPSSVLRDQIKIGKNALVGLGSVVTKNVPDGETWAGVPARPLKDFLLIEKKLKDLLASD